MTIAVLYRWRLRPGLEDEFREAWEEATKRIHRHCASYGARLHRSANGDYVSYARWPSEATRQSCFAREELRSAACFDRMRACVEHRYDEEVLELGADLLREATGIREVPTLATQRLVLRALRIEDAEALSPALCDSENVRFWLRPAVESIGEVQDILRRNISSSGVQSFAICERQASIEDGSLPALGWVILMDRREECAEIGYMTCPHAQGRGLAREAVARVLDYAFEERALRRVYADTDPENEPSVALLEALGFEFEGRLRADWKTHLGIRDTALYAKLRADLR